MAKKTIKRSFKQVASELAALTLTYNRLLEIVKTYAVALRTAKTQIAFSITGYTKEKKPNAISVPELIAIVGTAQKLGQQVTLSISGVEDGATLSVRFTDNVVLPYDLQY
jgi:hypothetical protein